MPNYRRNFVRVAVIFLPLTFWNGNVPCPHQATIPSDAITSLFKTVLFKFFQLLLKTFPVEQVV